MATEALVPALDPEAERLALEKAWAVPRGLWGFLTAADHHAVGRRFIATAFGFFILGGLLAGVMRLQLSRPDNHVVGPDLYDQIFTMHGTARR